MRPEGLEPSTLSGTDSQSAVYTNSTTTANLYNMAEECGIEPQPNRLDPTPFQGAPITIMDTLLFGAIDETRTRNLKDHNQGLYH